jgi:peroxiredoxin
LLGLGLAIVCARSAYWQAKAAKPLNVVTGVVTYGGEPLWEGRITLLGPDQRVATTLLAEDGGFRIVNPPLGTVQVALSNPPSGSAARNGEPVASELPGVARCAVPPRPWAQLPTRFAEPDTSGLTVEIGPGEQHLAVSVPLQDGDPPVVKKPVGRLGPEIGDEAPEIEGEDLAGELLRLSDYRGKVVALVFWAHWCVLCREQFPHYQSLCARTNDEPLVVLGVNCDPDVQFLSEQNELLGIPWRSWWDGASIGGPVTIAYRFQGFPAVVLIDDQGIIRHRNLRGAELDRAVDELVGTVKNPRDN